MDLTPDNGGARGRLGWQSRMGRTGCLPLLMLLLCILASSTGRLLGQQTEPMLPLSQRVTINLAAGVPQSIANAAAGSNAPQSNWLYQDTSDSPAYASATFVESGDANANWQPIGLPYEANVPRTFLNQASGGGAGSLVGNPIWYRLHFKVDAQYAGRKFLLNLEGTHTGVQVYINGQLLPGISQVTANKQATHVVGFVPVIVDLTPYLHEDGSTDNVIAIVVSPGSPWFETPGFSGAFRFGQAMNGLFRNVFMYVTNPVHIPANVYSNTKTWGTYVGTKSISYSPSATATADSAIVEVQTNVLNESATAQQVTLTTQIVDASGNVVVTAPPMTQMVAPMTQGSFPGTASPMFDQQITVPSPTLWYPNNSVYGKPYMYRVYHIVSVNGVVVDSAQSPLGIRMITWDSNFPYFNGHAQRLWGGSGRYDYPALGASVPDEQVWRDVQQFAAAGGNIWRPGHSTSSEEFVAACDAFGVMVDQPSGDGEGYWGYGTNGSAPSADDLQLKQELHRDMIIRDRSHPSILDWEEDNGGMNANLAAQLDTLENMWDAIQLRKQATRSGTPSYAFINECDSAGCEIAIKAADPDYPAFGAEYWDNVGTGRGLAWDNELAASAPYLDDWRRGREANAFGMAHWYFADTPGEVSTWSEYQNVAPPANAPSDFTWQNFVRSLGYSMVDQNRFPRLLYYIYEANWVPYQIKPMVALAHHWNRAYEYTTGTPIQQNAFSNCPAVRLLINGVAKDPLTGAALADQVPNPWNVNSSTNLTQNTTVMPGQVSWMVNYAAGSVTAECLDASFNPVSGVADTRTTAGQPAKIVLTAVPELVRPDGTSFAWTANGSDAAFVVAQVEDQNGVVVPTANNNVTFSVSGPATYMGGTEQVVADPQIGSPEYQDAFSEAHSQVVGNLPYGFFHAPGDPELNFEGGLQKIALRSTFTPGAVTVTASAPGLVSGSVTLSSVTPPAPVATQAPAIIVPPVSTAVTAGYDGTFTVSASGSGTLNYQWFLNNSAVQGATGTSYTTPVTTLADNGDSISVMVSSAAGYGSVSSNPVTLSVAAPAAPAITLQPQSQSAVVGQTATLSVTASGSPQLTYTWFENGVQVQSGSQTTYTTPTLMTPENDTYYVVVSNPLNKVQSANAVISVGAPVPVSITGSPVSQIVAANQPVMLSATVAGSAPYTYQWNFTPPNGAATILVSNTQMSNVFSYSIPAMSAENVGAYTITVQNAANVPVTSAAAQLTLAAPGVNLAYAMPATASSTQGACTSSASAPPLSGTNCLGAENAVDGSLTTRWASQSAGAPPATAVTGVDPSDLVVDLGSIQPFNTVTINWENASAAEYEIDYTNADPTTNPQWLRATVNNAGSGGTETLNFATVQGRYIRMHGTQRSTQYGYSIFEFQVYDLAQCGGSNERYTPSASSNNIVLDNQLNLTWTRTVQTDTVLGSQFTGVNAANYCASINMRLPTAAEALSISGNNNATCAFPGTWSTWTSTVNPSNTSETAIVAFNGSETQNVTNNYPGATLCTAGTFAGQAPVITAAPQPATVTLSNSAMFRVTATGVPAPSYQWFENNNALPGATEPTYITAPTAMTDSGATFSVMVSNGSGSSMTAPVALTVSATPVTNPDPPAQPPPTPGNPGTVTTPPYTPNNPQNPVIPAGPANSGNGNTNSTDTAIAGFGTGPSPASANLALGAVVTSTGDENGGLEPINAIDGNLTTRWSSAFDNASAMTINLGSVKQVGQVLLRWERAYGYQYQIRVSTDGVNFTPVFTQTAGQGGSENLVFPGVSAQYVQFYGIQRASQYGYSIYEMEVYAPVAPVIVTEPASETVAAGSQAQFSVVATGSGTLSYQWFNGTAAIPGATGSTYTTGTLSSLNSGSQFTVVVSSSSGQSTTSTAATLTVTNPVSGTANLALNKVATSSGDENGQLGPLNAVDGNLNTRWSSAFVDNASLQIDLGSPMLINKAVIYWENAYGSAYQINVSNDGQSWTPVFTQNKGQGGVETITFPAVIERFIQFQGIQRATPYGYSMFEFQVYGADLPSIAVQPMGLTVVAGAPATFSVGATSDLPLTYQWLLNGLSIPGATAPSYTTGALESANSGGIYTVNVTNNNGTSTSVPAILTVTSQAPAGPNLALNQPVTASSTQDPNGLKAAFAVDGSLTSRWGSAFVDPSWISVDLGSTQTINQVVLAWENAYGKAYQIQVSNDAMTWTTVFSQSNGQGGTENISFAPVSARYVRMYGTVRGTQYGYSLYEFQVYGPSAGLSILTQPTNQSATVGATATFAVTAGGTGSYNYQWLKNNTPISGATSATYTTPALLTSDNNSVFQVVIGNSAGNATVTSTSALISVTNYITYEGAIGVDLVNNTGGAWANNQVYVTVIGQDTNNSNAFAYVNQSGQVVDFTAGDSTAANHLTGPDGMAYGNYSFTLAQASQLKLPPFSAARAYISLGAPLYVGVTTDGSGKVTGFIGPNPQNGTDPNINTHFDWYELNYTYDLKAGTNNIYINTTQVDEFGLPLVLDVWATNATFHQKVGITESIAQIDSEFTAQVPAIFQPTTMSNLRILSPDKQSLAAGGANQNYFANTIQTAWTGYASAPVNIAVSGRHFTGIATGGTLNFTEVNPGALNQGETFVVQQPTTQDILACAGTMASGVAVTAPKGTPENDTQTDENMIQLQLENQICAATNRGVLLTPTNWTNVAAYYSTPPANYYSQFWHNHSLGGLAYGFSFDDNNNQSTTITTNQPEHMTFTVNW